MSCRFESAIYNSNAICLKLTTSRLKLIVIRFGVMAQKIFVFAANANVPKFTLQIGLNYSLFVLLSEFRFVNDSEKLVVSRLHEAPEYPHIIVNRFGSLMLDV